MKQFRYRDNVGRYEYPVITTSALDLLIRTEGQICRNQQSTYESHGGRGDCQQKGRTGHTFSQQQQGGLHGGTK